MKNNQFRTIIIDITLPQRQLIEAMNEFCREKFDFKGKTKEDAMEYISKHMKSLSCLHWIIGKFSICEVNNG